MPLDQVNDGEDYTFQMRLMDGVPIPPSFMPDAILCCRITLHRLMLNFVKVEIVKEFEDLPPVAQAKIKLKDFSDVTAYEFGWIVPGVFVAVGPFLVDGLDAA